MSEDATAGFDMICVVENALRPAVSICGICDQKLGPVSAGAGAVAGASVGVELEVMKSGTRKSNHPFKTMSLFDDGICMVLPPV
jgi:hypothetical protein